MFGMNKIIELATSDGEKAYREKCIANTASNNGWYKCCKCGKSFRASQMDADHIFPKSKGGSNDRENMQLICMHCNRSKGAKVDDTCKDFKENIKRLAKHDKEIKKDAKKFLKQQFK